VLNAEKEKANVGIGKLLIVSKNQESLVESSHLKELNRNSLANLVLNPGFTRFVFRAKEFDAIDFPEIRMAEDQVYLARSNFLDHKIYISDLLLYTYYVNIPDQATRNPSSLRELSKSLPLIYSLKNKSSSKTNQLLVMLVLKISLTCLFRRINTRNAIRYALIATISSPLDSFSVLVSIIRVKNDKK
jgi:hypothetical protein